MTIKDAYKRALSLDATTMEQDDSILDSVVDLTNMFLLATFDNENAIRLVRHMSPLSSPPVLKSIDDTVPYNDRLVGEGLVYYLASYLMKAGDDNTWSSRYYDMYINAVNMDTPILRNDAFDIWR